MMTHKKPHPANESSEAKSEPAVNTNDSSAAKTMINNPVKRILPLS